MLPTCGAAAGATAAVLASAAPAGAATWADWWLPPDYSAHGPHVDWLFNVIFWITMGVFVFVELLLVYFAIRYRHRPERRKGIFSHGNTKLEMIWTLAPAVVLIWIAAVSKRVWDEYRYGVAHETDRTQVMVIGQQFKWNFIYAGPDGKLGRYLVYPKPSDPAYAHKPADLAAKDVAVELQDNPLGQVMNKADANDPGLDDDYVKQPGRPLIIPANRPLEISLGSRDVLHSFFLPNFRVKLDAVPGMRGTIFFTATQQSTKTEPIELVPDDKPIWLDSSTPKAFVIGNPPAYQIFNPEFISPGVAIEQSADPNTLDVPKLKELLSLSSRTKRKSPWLQSLQSTLRDGAMQRMRERLKNEDLRPEDVAPADLAAEVWELRKDLKRMGIKQLAYVKQPFEIVCEELCGQGHSVMTGQMLVVSADQYESFIKKYPPGTAPKPPAAETLPTTAPTTTQATTNPSTNPTTSPATTQSTTTTTSASK
jgi:cytochrome c oxidase subunit 2